MGALPSDVMRAWFRRVWTEGDPNAITELFPPDGRVHGLGPAPVVGPTAFRGFWEDITQVLQELEIRVVESLDDGDRCYVRCEATANYRGARVQFSGGSQCTVRGGQILEAHDYWDFLGLLAQMQSLPPDAFPLALAGKRFA